MRGVEDWEEGEGASVWDGGCGMGGLEGGADDGSC